MLDHNIELFKDKPGWSQPLKDLVAVVKLTAEKLIHTMDAEITVHTHISESISTIADCRNVGVTTVESNIVRTIGFEDIHAFVDAVADFLEGKPTLEQAVSEYDKKHNNGGNSAQSVKVELKAMQDMYRKGVM